MKKTLLALVLVLALFVERAGETDMSDWQVIVPEATTNLISHPSVEAADISGFVAVNAATRARSLMQSKWGLYSLAITPHAANLNSGVYYQITGTATTTYTFSVWVHGSLGAGYTLRIIDGVPATLATQVFTGTGGWQLVEVTGTTAANTTVRCYLTADAAGGAVFYADGWQLEARAYRTTYCDGTRPGCEWNGIEHASTSQRSAQARAGGRVRDIQTDYALDVSGMVGVGTPPQTVHVDEFALLPGGETGRIKIAPRTFILTGAIHGSSHADLHSKRQALVVLFDPKAHPEQQPVTLRYTGAAVEKEIEVYYEDGLRGVLRAGADACHKENVVVRFTAPDPFWREIGESSQLLDEHDWLTGYRTISVRLKATGQWDVMGPPNPIGGYHTVLAIAEHPDGSIYIGGHFNNFDNQVSAQNVVMWDPVTGTYSPLGVGLDDTVRAIAITPDGQVYLAGEFTDIRTNPGGGTFNRVVRWDPVALTYNALGVGVDDPVYTLAVGHDGTLYVGGEFNNAGGAGAMHVAQWDPVGAAWAAIGVGLNNEVFASDVGLDGGIYFAGNFNDLVGGPGQTYSRCIKWNPVISTWTTLTSGRIINGHLNAIAVYKNNRVYMGGDFDTIDAETFNNVVMWNGTSLHTLGTGVDDEVHSLDVGPTGLLYLGGRMNRAGTIPAIGLALWTGSAWAHADTKMPAGEAVWSLLVTDPDPVVADNYNLYAGGSTPLANEAAAGLATMTNGGTSPGYPTIIIARGNGALAKLSSIRNETTGKMLLFDYDLLPGETLTIDLAPSERSVISSFFGSRKEAVLSPGNFGSFALQPGNNQATCFVSSTPAEHNDDNEQLSGWESISGLDASNTDAGRLYVSIIDLGGGWFRADLFDDAARGGGDLVGHTVNYNGVGAAGVVQDGGSGLGGYLIVDATTAADVDLYVDYFLDMTAYMVWQDTYRSFD